MTDQHPITPPPELVVQWCHEDSDEIKTSPRWYQRVCAKAARWGADQELDACCKALEDIWDQEDGVTLNDFLRGIRAARRPEPPSLKERIATAIAHGDNSIALGLLDQALPD